MISLPSVELLDAFSGKVYPGAGSVVIRGNKVLMVLVNRRNLTRWELPSGKQCEGEELEETAKRETKEETALSVNPIRPIAACWHYSNILCGAFLGVFYLCELSTEEANIEIKHQLGNADFEQIRKGDIAAGLEYSNDISKTYEDIVGVDFIEISKLRIERTHPLHYQIIHSYTQNNDKFIVISGNADLDDNSYSARAPIK